MLANCFRDKVILITGASSGIGRALATSFARRGADVVLVARDEKKLGALQEALSSLPGRRMVVPADVRVPSQVEHAVARAIEEFQRIDVLVNNAGKGYCATVVDTPLEDLRDVLETNFFGAFLFMRAVIPHMTQQHSGLMIQISSVNGFCAVPLGSAYCASKFALEGLSQSARLELKRHGIDVLIVRPGVTQTNFFDNAKNFRQQNPFPLHRMMSADQVAEKIVRAAESCRRDPVLTAEGRWLWWLKKFSPWLVDQILLWYVKPRPLTKGVAT